MAALAMKRSEELAEILAEDWEVAAENAQSVFRTSGRPTPSLRS